MVIFSANLPTRYFCVCILCQEPSQRNKILIAKGSKMQVNVEKYYRNQQKNISKKKISIDKLLKTNLVNESILIEEAVGLGNLCRTL